MSKTECCTKYGKTATGTSVKAAGEKSANLQEAIRDAVSNALAEISGADQIIKWKLECVTGEDGGLHGGSKLTAEISYSA
ncbi:MAG: hypothetical protein D3903_07355 [Candidatus Electrothrix sp. GM3_4]|nr:hypothetical protein [Candidatus Electrothrix sp. GM3_4]